MSFRGGPPFGDCMLINSRGGPPHFERKSASRDNFYGSSDMHTFSNVIPKIVVVQIGMPVVRPHVKLWRIMAKIMLLESRNLTFSRETRAGDVVSYSFFPKKSSRNPSLKRFILTQQFLQGSLVF